MTVFPRLFQTQQFVSPPEEVSSAERKPFVVTHPFSQRFLWQATKGAQLSSPMDPTQAHQALKQSALELQGQNISPGFERNP